MDPYTERLLERTRQRREALEKKMAEGSSPSRKRSSPLSISQKENIRDRTINDDSPQKKQCLRETEQLLKPDTPAVPSVKSRLQQISSTRREWIEQSENAVTMEVDVETRPVTSSVVTTESRLDDNTRKPASRKNRFAALAQTINSYEDDLSHHSFEPKEPPKKVWAPPKTTTETPKHTVGPAKPPRRSLAAAASPAKKHVVSEIKVTLGKSEDTDEVKLSIVPGKTTTCSPSLRATRVKGDEPTAKPVSARLAAWRETTDRDNQSAATSQPVSATTANWQKKIDKENRDAKKATPGPAVKTPSAVARGLPRSPVTKGNDFKEVMAKRAAAVEQYSIGSAASPQKTALLSPSKVGTATQSIHQRLEHLQNSWQSNEIAVKIKQQKQAELAQLENRWKDGILADDRKTSESDTVAVPPPPPPPTTAPATPNSKVWSPKKTWSPVKAPEHNAVKAKTPVPEKREDTRNKLRVEHVQQQCLSDGTVQSSGSITAIPHFEEKLKSMGFEVADSSHKATIDLKEQRRHDKAEADRKASQPSTKTATAHLKLAHVEDHKIVTTTFSDEKVTEMKTKVSTNVVTSSVFAKPKVNAGAPSSGSRPSIYNLIKKQSVGGASKPTTPEVYTRSRPGVVSGKRRDSFDSDESSFSEEPPRKLGAAASQESIDNDNSSTGVGRQGSFTSTQSSCSETQSSYSETVTDDYTTQTEYTEEDSYTDDDCSYSEESANGDIDELLEEALDDYGDEDEGESTDAEPTPAPRHKRPVSGQPTDQQRQQRVVGNGYPAASTQYRHETSERPTGQYANQRALVVAHQPSKRVTFAGPASTGGSSSSGASSGSGSCTDSATDSEMEKRRTVYSITKYRTKNAPTMTIVRHSEHERQHQPQEALPYIPEVSVKERLRELHELINQEQNVIMQTSNALNQCCGSNSTFAGSAEAVECHRLLLVSCKKREAYLAETQRLKQGTHPKSVGPTGSLTITDISLPLKQEFMSRIGTSRDNATHYFIILVRNGNHLVFTQMVSTHDAMVRGSLDFPNMIKLSDIKQDFRVNLEIYSMSVTREVANENTPKKKKFNTPKKKFFSSAKSAHHIGMQSPGGPRAVRSTNFHEIACLPITVHALNKAHFALERMPMSSPLQGSIHLRLTCLMENSIEERGFLTMFEDVCGFGAWHRRWCLLSDHTVSFWKYPDDENKKEPIGTIDLKQCITDVVGLIPRDVCARPNTFELRTVRRQLRGEADTLVTHCNNTLSTTRHWMSADTKADRLAWCDTLNQALHNIRMWHADALRPIKAKSLVCS